MPYQLITHYRNYVPAEALDLAQQFRAKADQARDIALRMKRAEYVLDGAWEGNAKQRYFQSLQPESANLSGYAGQLEHLAEACERITITESWTSWEWVSERNLT